MIFWIKVSDWIAHEENMFTLVHLNTMLFQDSLGQSVMLNESKVSGEPFPFHFANHVTLILWLVFWCDSLGTKQLQESCALLTHPERCKPVTTSGKLIWYPRKHHAQLSGSCFSLLAVVSNSTLARPLPEHTMLSVHPLRTAVFQRQVVTLYTMRVWGGFCRICKFIRLSEMDLSSQLWRPLKTETVKGR